MSELEARILWFVRDWEWTRIVWPPETRIDRNGKGGLLVSALIAGWLLVFGLGFDSDEDWVGLVFAFSRHETSRGVKRCACM